MATCAEYCFNCGINQKEGDDFLCRSCRQEYPLCYECGKRERVIPFKLCKRCHDKRQQQAALPVRPGFPAPGVEKEDESEDEDLEQHREVEEEDEDGDICLLPGCQEKKFLDLSGDTPTLHNFCCREHALQHMRSPPKPAVSSLESQPPEKVLMKLKKDQQTYTEMAAHFSTQWVKQIPSFPKPPEPIAIYAINNPVLVKKFRSYGKRIRKEGHSSNSDMFFHGTKLNCNLTTSDQCCSDPDCGICGISKYGFDAQRIGTNIPRFKRFGHGIYLAPNSSKCHDYTQGVEEHGLRAQLLCLVACGAKHELRYDDVKLSKPPPNFHSVHGRAGGNLNYDEIVVYDPAAVLPHYVIVYEREGVHKIAV